MKSPQQILTSSDIQLSIHHSNIVRAARLIDQNLNVIWDSCTNRTICFPLFHDAKGEVVSIPPPGKDRDDWPVQQAMRKRMLISKEYSVQVDAAGSPYRFLLQAYLLEKSGTPPLVLEEIEQIFPAPTDDDVLEKLDAQVNNLILGMVNRLDGEFGAIALNMRFPNPHLQPCYETRKCQKKDCPAYRSGARCWEVNQGIPHIDSSDSNGSKDSRGRCDQCDVFMQACRSSDPLVRICERVNRLLHLLQQKNQEALECYRQVQQAEKLATLGELTTGIAHEIKTPLSVIMGRLDCLSLEMDSLSTEEVAQDLEVIRLHASRMQQVLEEFLNLARPQAPKCQWISIDEMMKPALEVLRKTLEERHVRLTLNISQPAAMVYVDPMQIRQVLLNIILNARDAMTNGGDLTISTVSHPNSRALTIEIADTGHGISPENMERIFSPFFTTKIEKGGTGLGLMVCKRIMSRHDGSIEVQSAPGKGSKFTLVFSGKEEQK